MLVSLEGEEATGKTTWAYTAPLKVVGFQFDLGSQRALYGAKFDQYFGGLNITTVKYKSGQKPEPQWADTDITVYELPTPIQLDSLRVRGARELWDYFLVLLGGTLRDDSIKTIVIDTMTQARRVKVDAHLQSLQDTAKPGDKLREQLLQIEYGKPNGAIRDIYAMMSGLGKNLVAVHHLTDERVDSVNGMGQKERLPTGKRILEGLDGTHRLVDVALRLEKSKGAINTKFMKCGYSLELEGLVMPDSSWDSIAEVIMGAIGNRISIDKRAVTEGVS